MELTKQERALIELVRGLCFEDLLDATEGIRKESEKAAEQAIIASKNGETINSADFKERAENLLHLADVLGEANKDFRNHICPEEEYMNFAIDIRQNVAERFKTLADLMHDGWEFDKFCDNRDNDGNIYFTLSRPEEME
ncbi:hypothetical protein J27TS7_34110 [Paenibacillus dendritiformis]|uniref:hypothetical protein n=1 Tax=Paenibacillus dendritiformis TaxID=130049 RepID=UPI001B25C438|nr:hypothetical protein [Paenibacillus dendritiformis]GIO73897.1 hypothetical protein J27TS7_34110 [Paenibacillus dendritiformis]